MGLGPYKIYLTERNGEKWRFEMSLDGVGVTMNENVAMFLKNLLQENPSVEISLRLNCYNGVNIHLRSRTTFWNVEIHMSDSNAELMEDLNNAIEALNGHGKVVEI